MCVLCVCVCVCVCVSICIHIHMHISEYSEMRKVKVAKKKNFSSDESEVGVQGMKFLQLILQLILLLTGYYGEGRKHFGGGKLEVGDERFERQLHCKCTRFKCT
jgi:hypothetical protein